jgi:hypothetical protein
MTRHQNFQEDSPLIDKDVGKYHGYDNIQQLELAIDVPTTLPYRSKRTFISIAGIIFVVVLSFYLYLLTQVTNQDGHEAEKGDHELVPTGPYGLVEAHVGRDFFSYYEFYNGSDSLGSAGFNTYVSKSRAENLGIVGILTEEKDSTTEELVYLSSAPTNVGPRDSIRLEGKRRFERGLFILDVRHIPDGCGVWPAFWMTDEDAWPWNGEIDVLEGTCDIIFSDLR